jgi:hypothetical protein
MSETLLNVSSVSCSADRSGYIFGLCGRVSVDGHQQLAKPGRLRGLAALLANLILID